MSNISVLDGIPYNDYDDYQRGRDAIIYFHNAMIKLYPASYKLDLQGLIKGLTSRTGQIFFLEGLGNGIINAELSDKTVQMGMEYLAEKGKGQIPANNNTFVQNLSNQNLANQSFTDISSFVVLETGKDIIKGVAKVGEAVIETGDNLLDATVSIAGNLKWILPITIIGGALLYVYLMPKPPKAG